jgi:uroporphyrinogen-III decarboxylase
MNSKERMLAALQGAPTDIPPVAPIQLHNYLAEEVRRHALAGYLTLLEERQEADLDPAEEARIQAEAIIQAWEGLEEKPDWIWTGEMLENRWPPGSLLRREGERLWRIHPPSGAREELTELRPTAVDRDAWELPKPTSTTEIDERVSVPPEAQVLGSVSAGVIRTVVRRMGDRVFVHGKMPSPYNLSRVELGFVGQMTLPKEDPDLFLHLIARHTEAQKVRARAYKACGAHAIYLGENLTSADVISAAAYRRFAQPSTRAMLDEFRRLGLPSIFYICGHVAPRIQDVIDMAPTALVVEEDKKTWRNDLGEIARAAGKRLTLFGNLDSTRLHAWTDEELACQIRAQREATRPARAYICSQGSPIPLDTPRQRLSTMIRLARETL